MISNSRLLLPPLSRQRCFLRINPFSSKSLMARFTVLTDRCSSLAMVPIAGEQVPSLFARSFRYRYTATALWGSSASYIFLSYAMLNLISTRRTLLLAFFHVKHRSSSALYALIQCRFRTSLHILILCPENLSDLCHRFIHLGLQHTTASGCCALFRTFWLLVHTAHISADNLFFNLLLIRIRHLSF